MIKNFWYALVRFFKPLFTDDPLLAQYEQRLRDKDQVIHSQALIIASKEDKIRELYEEFINVLGQRNTETKVEVRMPSPITPGRGWKDRQSRLEGAAVRNRNNNEDILKKIVEAENNLLGENSEVTGEAV